MFDFAQSMASSFCDKTFQVFILFYVKADLHFNGFVFPEIWKVAKVTPIFKSVSGSGANNFRPISVVSVFPKFMVRSMNI